MKIRKTTVLFLVLALFTSACIFAQTKLPQKYADYPIKYLDQTGAFTGKVSVNELMESGHLINGEVSGFNLKTTIKNATYNLGSVEYLLNVKATVDTGNGTKEMNMAEVTMIFEFDDSEKEATLTYFKFENLANGAVSEQVGYDDNSKAECVGVMVGSSSILFDVDAINKDL